MKIPSHRQSIALLVAGFLSALAVLIALMTGLLTPAFHRAFDNDAYYPSTPVFQPVSFATLPGWRNDNAAEALPAFLRSCEKLAERDVAAPANSQENLGPAYEGFSLAGRVADWIPACSAAQAIKTRSYANETAYAAAVRVFFETEFRPVQIMAKRTPREDGPARGRRPETVEEGVFTGYYEPVFEARKLAKGRFSAPLYGRPDDLIDVDLGAFRSDLKGERIAGRIEGSRLAPYPDRRAINDGALDREGEPLAFLDPDELFFLQIQGSGKLVFQDGSVMRAGYAGANGRPYTAIGRILVENNEMKLEDASMASIRAWLNKASPEDAKELREANASYVFFRVQPAPADGLGPLGAQGAPLTPERSLAVDRRFHALGSPVFVDIKKPTDSVSSIRKLMIAQDTGGAIRGPVRGDVFWGGGEAAGAAAGAMNARGRMFVLLPRSRVEALEAFEPSP